MLAPVTEPLAYDFFLRALLASSMVGVVCAVIGSYMVLRGLAFMGDALSHSAFPGVVIAYLLRVPFYLGAAVAAVATALAIGWVTRRGNLRGDTAIGVLFAGMIVVSLQAVGIILVVAMLVTPAATAQLLTRSFGRLVAVAVLIGVVAPVIGLYASYWLNAASGATIVLVETGLFVLALVTRLQQGRR